MRKQSCTRSVFLPHALLTPSSEGNTIIQVVTIDPQLGLPTTLPIETIAAGLPTQPPLASSITSTPLTTSPSPVTTPTQPDGQQGPVGAPAPINGPAGPITYTYTTTDAAGKLVSFLSRTTCIQLFYSGERTAVVDVFTPTGPATTPFTPTGTGGVLDFSSYLQMVGTHTVPVPFSAGPCLQVSRMLLASGLALALGFAGGFGLVLA
jgi:hypothetical protein